MTGSAPLSFAQERLWLIDAAAPAAVTYNVPLLSRFREPANPRALAVALARVADRHAVLRTTYAVEGERPVQRVAPVAPVEVEVIDGSVGAEEAVAGRCRLPFDLTRGPVFRCTLLRNTPDGDLLLLVIHHIAVDGWSLPALYTDLVREYRAACAGERTASAPAALTYTDFARWDRDTFTGEREERVERRAAQLRDVPTPVLAGALTPDGSVDRPGKQCRFTVPDPLRRGINDLARARRVTPFVVLYASFQAVLAHRSGLREFLLGAVTANRPRPDAEDLVGFFVNTVPLRCDVPAESTFADLCTRSRAEAYGMLTHQWIPFGQLTAAVAAHRADGHRDLVDVGFAVQNFPAVPDDGTWPFTAPEVLATGTAKFGLLLIVEETPRGMLLTVEYATDRYPEEVAIGVTTDLLATLTAAVADPGVRLRDLPLRPVTHAGPEPRPEARPVAPRNDPAVPSDAAVALFDEALATVGRRVGSGTADFFALGGNSLLAVTMLSRAGRRHGVAVSPRDFLADPTVDGLARLLAGTAEPPEPAMPTGDRFPATSAQQRFWMIDRIDAVRQAYLMPAVLELTGPVDHTALRAAVTDVLGAHPALRARFTLDRRARAVVYNTDGESGPVTLAEAPPELDKHVAARCWEPFDLGLDAPARADIVTCGDGRTLLLLVVHHIAADGHSQRLLLGHIAAAYRARAAGTAPRPVTGIHPAALRRPSSAATDAQTDALIASLDGAPVDVDLPHDRHRPDVQSTLAGTVTSTVDGEVLRRLRAVATDNGCTTFMVTAALLAVALARRSHQRDFVFAFPWGLRDDPSAADAVAMLVNTSALRADLRGVTTWHDLLGRVRRAGSVAYRNGAAAFDRVAAALHPDRDLSRPPLTPVYLSMAEGTAEPAADLDFGSTTTVRPLPLTPLHIKYELELTASDHPDRLDFGLAYAVRLFDHDTAAHLVAALAGAARDLAADPGSAPLPPGGST